MSHNTPTTGTPATFTASEILRYFCSVSYAFFTGELLFDEFHKVVEELVFKDVEGNLWVIGISSGEWYRKVGSDWVLGTPYGPLTQRPESTRIPPRVSAHDARTQADQAIHHPIIQEFLRKAQ